MITPPQTAEFDEWFANSVVIDTKGAPLIMYHGTTRGGFGVFDRLKTREWRRPSMDNIGSWFSDNPSEDGGAAMYVMGSPGACIYPVYLSIQRPKRYFIFADFLRDMHEAAGRPVPASAPGLGSTEELRARLMSEGYDGIEFEQTANGSLMSDIQELTLILRQTKKEEFMVSRQERLPYTQKRMRLESTLAVMNKELIDLGGSTEFDKQRVFIAFEPEQIKSVWNERPSRAHRDVRCDLLSDAQVQIETTSPTRHRQLG